MTEDLERDDVVGGTDGGVASLVIFWCEPSDEWQEPLATQQHARRPVLEDRKAQKIGQHPPSKKTLACKHARTSVVQAFEVLTGLEPPFEERVFGSSSAPATFGSIISTRESNSNPLSSINVLARSIAAHVGWVDHPDRPEAVADWLEELARFARAVVRDLPSVYCEPQAPSPIRPPVSDRSTIPNASFVRIEGGSVVAIGASNHNSVAVLS